MAAVVTRRSWISFIPGVDNYSFIRTIRVLRPLRTVTRIAGMRVMVNALLSSIVPLSNVLLLSLCIFFIFGTIGMILMFGTQRNRCGLRRAAVSHAPLSCVFAEGPLSGLPISGVEQTFVLCSNITGPFGGRGCPEAAADSSLPGQTFAVGPSPDHPHLTPADDVLRCGRIWRCLWQPSGASWDHKF